MFGGRYLADEHGEVEPFGLLPHVGHYPVAAVGHYAVTEAVFAEALRTLVDIAVIGHLLGYAYSQRKAS